MSNQALTTLQIVSAAPFTNAGLATPVDCGEAGATVTNGGSVTVYYNDELPVSTSSSSLTAGSTVSLTGTYYFQVFAATSPPAVQTTVVKVLRAAGSSGAAPIAAGDDILFNVRDYGAMGAYTDDTAEIQACIDAAYTYTTTTVSAAPVTVFIPPGRYVITAPLTVPNTGGGIRIVSHYGELMWFNDSDIPDAAWALQLPNGGAPWYVEGLVLNGPGKGTAGVETDWTNGKRGIRCQGRGQLVNCKILDFEIGVDVIGDHQRFYRCDFQGNSTGMYWSSAVNGFGDHVIDSCDIASCQWASVALAPSAQILQLHAAGSHFGGGPFCFYARDGGGGAFVSGGTFINCSFEGASHGMFYDDGRTKALGPIVFINTGTDNVFATPLAGKRQDAVLDADLIYGIQWFGNGPTQAGTHGIFAAKSGLRDCMIEDARMDTLISVTVGAGKPIAWDSSGAGTCPVYGCRFTNGSMVYALHKISGSGTGVAQKDLVATAGDNLVSKRTSTNEGVYGVALHAAAVNEIVAVATQGGPVNVKTAGVLLRDRPVKPNAADPAAIDPATMADADRIGICIATGAGTIYLRP